MDEELSLQSVKLLANIRGYLRMNEKERAVTEAARAYCDAMDGVPGAGKPENKWGPLWDAVRALDALEEK